MSKASLYYAAKEVVLLTEAGLDKGHRFLSRPAFSWYRLRPEKPGSTKSSRKNSR